MLLNKLFNGLLPDKLDVILNLGAHVRFNHQQHVHDLQRYISQSDNSTRNLESNLAE